MKIPTLLCHCRTINKKAAQSITTQAAFSQLFNDNSMLN